ncbi:MAG: hypothetical protein ICV53_00475 [Flavisolibacter sp.]|nr:hypothetical protein [Flavisolibacter sp.]
MLLPNADKAIINKEKITGYVLSFDHFEGRNKARVFASILGIKKEHADYLMQAIRKAIQRNDAVKQSDSPFGTKYTLDFDLTFGNKAATIRTAWIVEHEEGIPGLTTCYIKL